MNEYLIKHSFSVFLANARAPHTHTYTHTHTHTHTHTTVHQIIITLHKHVAGTLSNQQTTLCLPVCLSLYLSHSSNSFLNNVCCIVVTQYSALQWLLLHRKKFSADIWPLLAVACSGKLFVSCTNAIFWVELACTLSLSLSFPFFLSVSLSLSLWPGS